MTYRAALVGVGGVGEHHGNAYEAVDGVELVCVADVDEDLLSARGEAWGVADDRRYADHRAMLDAEDVDVVSVATPTPFHHDHVTDAATSSGAPDVIWCEKPAAESVADAAAMAETCEERGVELVVNHSRRWAEELRTLRRLLTEERILGDVRSMTAQCPVELLRNGTHLVDMAYYLLDGRPTRVSGHLSGTEELSADAPVPVDDCGGVGYVVFDDGATFTLDATLPRATSPLSVRLTGSGGKLSLDMRGGEIRYWRMEDGSHVETELPALADGWRSTYSGRFVKAVENVVALLDGDEPNYSPGREAVEVLEILVGLFVSDYADGHVSLPLDRPLRDVRVRSW